MNITSFLSGES
jgi:hypothetical protein